MSRLEKTLREKYEKSKARKKYRVIFLFFSVIFLFFSIFVVNHNIMRMFGEEKRYNIDKVTYNVSKYFNVGIKEADKISKKVVKEVNVYIETIQNKIQSK